MYNTGNTVLNDDGVFSACMERQVLCGYACCKFRGGNWIMLLPGEYELADEVDLKTDHLAFQDNLHAICSKPCKNGDLKPMDCSWYPLFPANETATKFLVADHRKCPIPNKHLIDKMRAVHTAALTWEKRFPGALKRIVALSRDFVGYKPFPYKLDNQSVLEMLPEELLEITLPTEFSVDYVCMEWTSNQAGYTATSTPEDED
ncbi:hypothetical protein [Methylomonas sp. LWB]|uniref:hypothetical protein n=1 Tax=Methylomonas sp. LWB TaxID=1905845 RepID=UPI0011153F80|nr:hypothetical protein [Methylomonas sp. LWB]